MFYVLLSEPSGLSLKLNCLNVQRLIEVLLLGAESLRAGTTRVWDGCGHLSTADGALEVMGA